MRKFYLSLIAMLTLCANTLWAGEVSVSFTFKTDKDITYTKTGTTNTGGDMEISKSGVTLTSAAGYTELTKSLSIYKNNKLTITAPGEITEIALSYNGKVFPFDEALGDGTKATKWATSGAHPASYKPETPAKSITLNNPNTGKTELLTLTVKYNSALSATDKNGKEIASKFTTTPLTVKYGKDATGLTFKVNGTEATYDATAGLQIKAALTSKANDKYTVEVLDGENVVASQTYIWIPTAASVTALKAMADETEAILSMSNAKVTYTTSDSLTAYIQDATRGIYAYKLGVKFTPYKQSAVNIWAKKTTYNHIVEIVACDSTILSTVTPSATAVTPTAKTVAQTKLADNQLTYVKVTGAKIVKDGTSYYAVAAADSVLLYDFFKTSLLTNLEKTPTYADITGIISITKDSVAELFPTVLENVSDKITGTCGTVTWTIDMDGNMVFKPTTGDTGTLETLGTMATKRPWSSAVASIKTVKFEGSVATAADPSYMFKDMANLEAVDFTNFNTSAATTVKGLFQNCARIKTVDFSGIDIAAVNTFTQAFDGCKALKYIDMRNVSTALASKNSKAANMFANGCDPDTLIISKNFGKTADGTYVALPTHKYMALDEAGMRVAGKNFTLPTDQTALYEYNEGLANYGTYVTYEEEAALQVATFDEETLDAESVKQYATADGFAPFQSGDFTLQNYSGYGGTYFSAFTLTNKTTTTANADYTDSYESACGGAKSGSNYVVWNQVYGATDSITVSRPSAISGFYVSNTTYAENVILNGNYSARKLNLDGDNFILHIYGFDADGKSTGSVDYTLAFVAEGKLSYVKAWRWVNLSTLGATTKYLKFTMSGTDSGDWGLNTPAYFAMDDLGGTAPEADAELTVVDLTTTGITSYENDASTSSVTYENGAAYNIAGQRVNGNARGIIIRGGKKFIMK